LCPSTADRRRASSDRQIVIKTVVRRPFQVHRNLNNTASVEFLSPPLLSLYQRGTKLPIRTVACREWLCYFIFQLIKIETYRLIFDLGRVILKSFQIHQKG